jgi:hypothetical protein
VEVPGKCGSGVPPLSSRSQEAGRLFHFVLKKPWGKSGSGVPPLFSRSQEAERLFHFVLKKPGSIGGGLPSNCA